MSRAARERYAVLRQSFWRHPSLMMLSPAAAGVYARMLSYSADALTDGVAPASVVLGVLAGGCQQWIDELVSSGAVEARGSDYVVVDYLKHNRSKAELDAYLERKKTAGKAGGKAKALAGAKAGGVAGATAGGVAKGGSTSPSKTLVDIDLDLDRDLPLQSPSGAEAEEDEPKTLPEQVAAQVRLKPTPGSAYRLMELLSALHCQRNGAPYIEPGGVCSQPDRKLLAKVIARAESMPDAPPMAHIADEWTALIALAAAQELPPIANAVAYFAKCFGDLERRRSELAAPHVPARILEAA